MCKRFQADMHSLSKPINSFVASAVRDQLLVSLRRRREFQEICTQHSQEERHASSIRYKSSHMIKCPTWNVRAGCGCWDIVLLEGSSFLRSCDFSRLRLRANMELNDAFDSGRETELELSTAFSVSSLPSFFIQISFELSMLVHS